MKLFKRLLLVYLLTGTSLHASAQINNALTGAGSTLAYPLLSKVFNDYTRSTKQMVNYQANGSGTGIALLNQKTIDFAVIDFAYTAERSKRPGPTVYIPVTTSVVAIAYNIPGLKTTLKLNAAILTDIYAGKITNWNDSRIAELNTGIKLPNLKIVAAHRSDDSGSTEIFTKYFKDDTNWAKNMRGIIPAKWPVGMGIKSTQGIAGLVKLTPGAIGYIALPYFNEYKIPVAVLQLKNGSFVSAGKPNYPLTGTTGIVVYQQQEYNGRSLEKARQLTKLLHYTVSHAQKIAGPLNYKALSASDINKANGAIHAITYNGKNL